VFSACTCERQGNAGTGVPSVAENSLDADTLPGYNTYLTNKLNAYLLEVKSKKGKGKSKSEGATHVEC